MLMAGAPSYLNVDSSHRMVELARRNLVGTSGSVSLHPVITSYDNHPTGPRTHWTVDDYFDTGPRLRDWMGSQVTWDHRTIEYYVTAVTDAGLIVTALRECQPDPLRLDGHPEELARRRRVPLFLMLNTRI
jgi:hypothetical protein